MRSALIGLLSPCNHAFSGKVLGHWEDEAGRLGPEPPAFDGSREGDVESGGDARGETLAAEEGHGLREAVRRGTTTMLSNPPDDHVKVRLRLRPGEGRPPGEWMWSRPVDAHDGGGVYELTSTAYHARLGLFDY